MPLSAAFFGAEGFFVGDDEIGRLEVVVADEAPVDVELAGTVDVAAGRGVWAAS
jgi:hypothetical protein